MIYFQGWVASSSYDHVFNEDLRRLVSFHPKELVKDKNQIYHANDPYNTAPIQRNLGSHKEAVMEAG